MAPVSVPATHEYLRWHLYPYLLHMSTLSGTCVRTCYTGVLEVTHGPGPGQPQRVVHLDAVAQAPDVQATAGLKNIRGFLNNSATFRFY